VTNRTEFELFLELVGMAKQSNHGGGYTPYANDLLRSQAKKKGMPALQRVLCWLILQSWGLVVKSEYAIFKGRTARQGDIVKALGIDKRNVSDAIAQLQTYGWLRVEDDDRKMYPQAQVKADVNSTTDSVEEWIEPAFDLWFENGHPELLQKKAGLLKKYAEVREQERRAREASRPKFETLLKSETERLALIAAARIAAEKPLVVERKKSRVQPTSAPPILNTRKEFNRDTAPATQSQPTPPPPTSPDTRSAKTDKSTPPAPPSSLNQTSYEVSEWFFIRQKQALVQKEVETLFGFQLKPTDPLLSKFVQLAADNRVSVNILAWWMADLKRAKQKARYPVESAGAILNFGTEDFAPWVERNRSKIDDAMRQQVEVPPTQEEVITTALHLAEGPGWSEDPRRAEWIKELEQYNQRAVERVRAQMKERGDL
jgi:hypothetical protein